MLALTVCELSKTYPNGQEALKKVNFTVAEGDFFALLGPNGAGKSTAISIISGLLKKSSGKVHIFKDDLDIDPSSAKANIGIVPQEFNCNIFEKVEDIILTQAGYFGIPRKAAAARANMLLQRLDLADKRNSPAGRLSGGMKRRLLIARALIHNPRLLILDEPTAGVDVELRLGMWDFLQEMNRLGTTIILTTHYLEEAERLCQNIGILNKGTIIKQGPMKQLLSHLGSQHLILTLREANDPTLVFSQFGLKQIDTLTLEASLASSDNLSDLFAYLATHKITVAQLASKTNRLESVFLDLVKQ